MVNVFPQSSHIPLGSINFYRFWNLHPWDLDTLSPDLSESFSRTGILHPPIVIAKDDNRFDILCGFRRLLFAKSENQTQINCLLLAKETKPANILDIVLEDQCSAQGLSMAEKAQFVKICTHFFQHRHIVDSYFDRLQLRKRLSTVETLLEILKQDTLLISEIHKGGLQEKMVVELLSLPEVADRIALVNLFKSLSMGDGKQKKIFPLIRDLAFHNNISIAAYLTHPQIEAILNHADMNNPQKVQHLSNLLQQQLHPLSGQAEDAFTEKIRALQLPKSCSISHSPSFEKDEVTLSIRFENLSSCENWIPVLKQNLA